MEKKQDTGNLDPNGPNATGGEARRNDKLQDKTSIGGNFNSGVTSADPQEKEEIEKQGSMLNHQPGESTDQQEDDQAH